MLKLSLRGFTNAALARIVLVGALTTAACVPVERLPLSKPAVSQSGGLTVEAPTVAASTAFLAQRGGDWSVFATMLSATNGGKDPYVLELEHATLVLSDPGGELPEMILPATASGRGPVPEAIPLVEPPTSVALAPGELVTAWVAFRARDSLVEADLRRRIVLHVPVSGGGQPLELVLAEPSAERPRWKLATVKHASYAGVSASGTFDEGSIGVLRTSGKSVVGPVVLAPAFELGVRAGKIRGESEPSIVCCDIGLAFDVVVPVARNAWTSVGPTLGYHAVFAGAAGRTDRATWHGPSVGFTFFASPIVPRTAGALPVRTTASVLGYSAFSLQYVHWFRTGDGAGSPGGVVTFERSFPEW